MDRRKGCTLINMRPVREGRFNPLLIKKSAFHAGCVASKVIGSCTEAALPSTTVGFSFLRNNTPPGLSSVALHSLRTLVILLFVMLSVCGPVESHSANPTSYRTRFLCTLGIGGWGCENRDMANRWLTSQGGATGQTVNLLSEIQLCHTVTMHHVSSWYPSSIDSPHYASVIIPTTCVLKASTGAVVTRGFRPSRPTISAC